MDASTMFDSEGRSDHRPQTKDPNYIHVKKMFRHRVQQLRTVYGRSLDRLGGHQCPSPRDGLLGEERRGEEEDECLGERSDEPGEERVVADETETVGEPKSESSPAEEQAQIQGQGEAAAASPEVNRYSTEYGEFSTAITECPAGHTRYLAAMGRYQSQYLHSESPEETMDKEESSVEEALPSQPVPLPAVPQFKPIVLPLVLPKPKLELPELITEKEALSQELTEARQALEQINQIVVKNQQGKAEKREMQDLRDALSGTMAMFAEIKQSLILNHQDLETKCREVSKETKEEEDLRQQIGGVQDKINSIVSEQKICASEFQDRFSEVTNSFQYVKNGVEVNDKLIREKQEESREYQVMLQRYNSLLQKGKDMEEKLSAITAKYEQIQQSLSSSQKDLADTTADKIRLGRELSSIKKDWISLEQSWSVEKKTMDEFFKNEVIMRDRIWMWERDELLAEHKSIGEDLSKAQLWGDELESELDTTRSLMQAQRKALMEIKVSLEKSRAEKKTLKNNVFEKDLVVSRLRNTSDKRDTEIDKLTKELASILEQLKKLGYQERRRFTLKGLLKDYFQKEVDKLIEQTEKLIPSP